MEKPVLINILPHMQLIIFNWEVLGYIRGMIDSFSPLQNKFDSNKN